MKKTKVVLLDDVDGSEATHGYAFAFKGVNYEIDLNDEHSELIESDFGKWISSARRVGGRLTSRRAGAGVGTALDSAKVREWARGQGIVISDRGRIPAEVIKQYAEAAE